MAQANLSFTFQNDADFIPTFSTVPPYGEKPQFCTAKLAMVGEAVQHGVSLSADATMINIARGSRVDLNFVIRNAAAGSTFSYIPVGLALKVALITDLPIGGTVFPSFTVDRNGLTVEDRRDQDKGTVYNFLIAVQRSDGRLGVIDPQIKNET